MPMSKEQRQAFLAGVHVGILSIAREGRGPLSTPVWYDYTPGGEVWFITDRNSIKGRLLDKVERITLIAQEETSPYKYVSIEGPFTIEPSDNEQHLRPMARRYLGKEGGDAYVTSTGGVEPEGGSIVVRITPEQWFSVDYSR